MLSDPKFSFFGYSCLECLKRVEIVYFVCQEHIARISEKRELPHELRAYGAFKYECESNHSVESSISLHLFKTPINRYLRLRPGP